MLQRPTHFPLLHQPPPWPTPLTAGRWLPREPCMGPKPMTEKENLCKKRFDPQEQLFAVFLETNWISIWKTIYWEQPYLNGEVRVIPHATACSCSSAKWCVQSILIILYLFVVGFLFCFLVYWLGFRNLKNSKILNEHIWAILKFQETFQRGILPLGKKNILTLKCWNTSTDIFLLAMGSPKLRDACVFMYMNKLSWFPIRIFILSTLYMFLSYLLA